MHHLIQSIGNGWHEFLNRELDQQYMLQLRAFLYSEMATEQVYPEPCDWFKSFEKTSPADCLCVVIGQDPYFRGEAMGLSFSVKPGFKLTPSARNILKEVTRSKSVTGYTGNLENWAEQGVLLLNSCLTTRAGVAGAHSKKGWETLTGRVVSHLNEQERPVVYLAWGRWAHKVCAVVNNPKHLVIKTSHPSPRGATKNGDDFTAFLGSECFIVANQFLASHGLPEIDWTSKLEIA